MAWQAMPANDVAGAAPVPRLVEEEGFEAASVFEDDDFTQRRYEEIKAKTMFNMIEVGRPTLRLSGDGEAA